MKTMKNLGMSVQKMFRFRSAAALASGAAILGIAAGITSTDAAGAYWIQTKQATGPKIVVQGLIEPTVVPAAEGSTTWNPSTGKGTIATGATRWGIFEEYYNWAGSAQVTWFDGDGRTRLGSATDFAEYVNGDPTRTTSVLMLPLKLRLGGNSTLNVSLTDQGDVSHYARAGYKLWVPPAQDGTCNGTPGGRTVTFDVVNRSPEAADIVTNVCMSVSGLYNRIAWGVLPNEVFVPKITYTVIPNT